MRTRRSWRNQDQLWKALGNVQDAPKRTRLDKVISATRAERLAADRERVRLALETERSICPNCGDSLGSRYHEVSCHTCTCGTCDDCLERA